VRGEGHHFGGLSQGVYGKGPISPRRNCEKDLLGACREKGGESPIPSRGESDTIPERKKSSCNSGKNGEKKKEEGDVFLGKRVVFDLAEKKGTISAKKPGSGRTVSSRGISAESRRIENVKATEGNLKASSDTSGGEEYCFLESGTLHKKAFLL